jgi:hypothetical protein
MPTIELGPAGQDGDSFNITETRQIWEAIERASENGETTVILISGEPTATLGPPPVHRTADGYEIHEGDKFWDNNLRVVTVTKVASYSEANHNPDNGPVGALTWWHDTTDGMADGSRLAKRHPDTRQIAGS